ncbi:MAG TPA: ROK family protein [Blastocatellia bacterium]|jgi:glucokinase|nr:ROK family protein [Blastocatellia bacterium]
MSSFVLGIDLGGTKVSAGVLDADGKVFCRERAKTKAWRDSSEIFATIARVGHRAIREAGVDSSQIAAVGIGSPGPLDPDTGYVIESANVNFHNFPLGPKLAEEFGCPVVVANDVDAGTYGEFRLGSARGARDVLGVFIGTGIGGGLIVNGALYHGFSKNAGEIGHIVIKAGGPRCNCGNRGCLEALASRTAMARDIRKAIKRGRKTMLARLSGRKLDSIPSSAIKEAFEAGDHLVTRVVERAADYIGIAIGSVVNLIGPEVVVLGGGVIEALGAPLIDRIDRVARKVAFDFAIKDVRFVRSELGDDAGIIGAAMLARERASSSL